MHITKLKILTYTFVLALSFEAKTQSFVCPQNSTEYKGVTCCLESVSLRKCMQIVDELPGHVLQSLEIVQANYDQQRYKFGRVPNCFWNALNFVGNVVKEPQTIHNYEYQDVLEQSHVVSDVEPTYGDLISFIGVGETREDILENNVPKKVWVPYKSLEHAAVYITEGIIFQKENIGTDVFSISSLNHTKKAYEGAFNSLPVRGEIVPEIWTSK